jgi:PAS domain-containing protein
MENTVLLKAIIDNAIDGLITIDDQGIIESINPSACKLFSYTEQEMLDKNISMLMPQPYRADHDGYLFRYKETGDASISQKKMAGAILRLYHQQIVKRTFFSITRDDLAAMACMATETVSRTQSDFRDEKLIEREGITITVLDPERLAKTKN